MRRRINWIVVQRFFDDGNDIMTCCKTFRFSYGAWVKAVKRGQIALSKRKYTDGRRRHDWRSVQAYYDEGHSMADCMSAFSLSRGAWHKAVRRGEFQPRPLARPLDNILATSRSRSTIKRRLLAAGLLENRCSECGLTDWQGEPLAVQVDHINGVRNDHRPENLRMLCPNCHSQTGTYGRRRQLREAQLREA